MRDAAALAGIEGLPWDRWGLARSFHATRNVRPEQALDVDALAQTIDPAPDNRGEAKQVLAQFPWAAPNLAELGALEGRSL